MFAELKLTTMLCGSIRKHLTTGALRCCVHSGVPRHRTLQIYVSLSY